MLVQDDVNAEVTGFQYIRSRLSTVSPIEEAIIAGVIWDLKFDLTILWPSSVSEYINHASALIVIFVSRLDSCRKTWIFQKHAPHGSGWLMIGAATEYIWKYMFLSEDTFHSICMFLQNVDPSILMP